MSNPFDLFLGVTLLAAFINTYLYGIVSTQYMRYFSAKFKDPLVIKAVVCALFILDSTQTISAIWMMYNYCVSHFSDVAYLSHYTTDRFWPFIWSVLSNAVNALLTQCVLSYRLFRLTKNHFILGGFICFALLTWGVCSYSQIRTFLLSSNPDFMFAELTDSNKFFAASRVMDVVEDIGLTVSLFIILHRARTGFDKTDSIINNILLGAIKTGFFCMIMSLLGAAIFFTPKLQDTMVFSLVAITQGKVSTNVLLDSLLRRRGLNRPDAATHANTTASFFAGPVPGQVATTNTVELRVRKDITTQVVTDDGDSLGKNVSNSSRDSDAFGLRGMV